LPTDALGCNQGGIGIGFLPYEEKFSGLIRMFAEATKSEFEIVIVAKPEILGDGYVPVEFP
jgi:hypothetical protein